MRNLLLTIVMVFALSLAGCIDQEINTDLPKEELSAKDLVEIAEPYVKDYWGDRKYYLGEIVMFLDENHEGKVELWYKDDSEGWISEAPNIIVVEIDTKQKKILKINKQESNTKIEPGIIYVDQWKADSDDALQIAKEAFKDDPQFAYTIAFLNGVEVWRINKEIWTVSLFNSNNGVHYSLRIDAKTGKVLDKERKE